MNIGSDRIGWNRVSTWCVRWILPALAAGAILSGCRSVETASSVGAVLGVAAGILTESQAESLKKTTVAVAKSFTDITPEQEYYIGRTVAAVVLEKYIPHADDSSTQYINVLGQTLAKASDLPETFGGYHFLILNSDDINAFAAPGGLIFITRGMIRCCRTEDALAAVLAHEIGHVQSKHGLQAIRKSRITEALMVIGTEGTKTLAGGLPALTQTFQESIGDIVKTVIDNGYSREFEREADLAAIEILKRVGYNPVGLADMLEEMAKRLKPGGFDFAKTHPSPGSRIEEIRPRILAERIEASGPRQIRFSTLMAGK